MKNWRGKKECLSFYFDDFENIPLSPPPKVVSVFMFLFTLSFLIYLVLFLDFFCKEVREKKRTVEAVFLSGILQTWCFMNGKKFFLFLVVFELFVLNARMSNWENWHEKNEVLKTRFHLWFQNTSALTSLFKERKWRVPVSFQISLHYAGKLFDFFRPLCAKK